MTSSPTNNSLPEPGAEHPAPHHGRRIRAALLFLLLLAGLLAAGSLFVRQRLDELRRTVLEEARDRLGARFSVGSVSLSGLRGVAAMNVRVQWEAEGGARVVLDVPSIELFVDWSTLFAGRVSPGHIHFEGASADITLPAGPAAAPKTGGAGPLSLPKLPDIAFRVSGAGCAVRLHGLPGGAPLAFGALHFDITRPSGAADVLARISALLDNDPKKTLGVVARYASPGDFDLRADCGPITAEEVNARLPEEARVLVSGTVVPRLRMDGYADNLFSVALDMPMDNVAARGQPEFIPPLTGMLAAQVEVDLAARQISVRNARLQTPPVSGRVTGTVSLAENPPTADLRLDADTLPVNEAVQHFLPMTAEYGKAEVVLGAPHHLGVRLGGPLNAPRIVAEAGAASGSVTFRPKDKNLPGGTIQLGQMQVSYDTGTGMPGGIVAVLDGGLLAPYQGIMLDKLSGSIVLADGQAKLDPVSANINGHAFLGRARYNLEKKTLEFSAEGAISSLEKSILHRPSKELWLYGAASVRCSGTASANRIEVEASADATEAQIEIEWWFRKPIGTGATIKTFKAVMIPKKSLDITGEASIDGTQLTANLQYLWRNGKFSSERVRLDIPVLEVATAGKCIRIPYSAYGTRAVNGFYEVVRAGDRPEGNLTTLGGFFEDVSFIPNGCPTPLHCRNATVAVTLDNVHETIRTGVIAVHAEHAEIPALSEKWLLPLEPEDPGYYEEFPGLPRTMTYELSADHLEMPPWKGTEFKTTVRDLDGKTSLDPFMAVVDGGHVKGVYIHEKESNIYTLKAEWDDIPTKYIIRHLEFPEILEGRMTGWVDYSMDQDDPGTLSGKGSFEVKGGTFIPTVVAERFGEQLAVGVSQLQPGAYAFSSVRSDLALQGDHIQTDNMAVVMDGMTIRGGGVWITDGDIDYTLNISVHPETALQIPLFREYFNLQGHRLTQQNIDLGFRITGPAFKPTSQLAGLPPMGVTLVSGAAEMTSETVKIIDLPRQLFMALIKTGGGILGASRSGETRP
ncbi:MAG: AsmA-like C-terminal region-containing protein [Candidatus Hydrogenedens sp.]|nr:hypothetical protein [Candidatus Hydrogenedentota bacterium]NLF56848.1 AsmA-like C-terminal region-containing protein [Candidatus Hydrogenedens sp.]